MSMMKHYGKKFKKIKNLLKKDDPIIVEVGAHYGEDTLRFVEVFPKLKIYCFEPDTRNINIFKKIVKSNNVYLIEKAVSNKTGHAEFFSSYSEYSDKQPPSKYDFISINDYNRYMLHNSGASSLKKGYDNCLSTKNVVETVRLDMWLKSNLINYIDFMWIDVQGGEFEVIDGLGSQVKQIHYLWIEYGELFYNGAMDRSQTISLLSEKGFELLHEYSDTGSQGDLLFINRNYVGFH